MRNRLNLSRPLYTIAGLLSLYAILISLILVVTRQLFQDAVSEDPSGSNLFLPLLLLLPIPLLGALVYQLFRLKNDRRLEKTGAKLKTRITRLFIIITLLASIPQGALALSFITSSLDSWFSAGFGESLKGGLQVILNYHHENTNLIQSLANDSYFYRDYSNLGDNTLDTLWKAAKSRAPNLRAYQVFSSQGKPLVTLGDPTVFLDFDRIAGASSGVLPKESSSLGSLLHTYKFFRYGDSQYHLVFTLVLPTDYDAISKQMTKSLAAYGQLESYFDTFRWSLFIFLFLFSLPLFFTTVLIAFSFSDDLIRPIINLEKATKKVSLGDYSIRILTPPQDEMGSLVESFNTMVSELSHSRSHLAQSEKISTWKTIAQQLAHELRNPLTPIRLATERILKRYREQGIASAQEVLESSAEVILGEVKKLDTLLKKFSDFARMPAPTREKMDINALISALVKSHQIACPEVLYLFEEPKRPVIILGDEKQLESLLTNLLKNAEEAMGLTGTIGLSCREIQKGQDKFVRIRVQDTGPGVPEEDRFKIFSPYYTTKTQGTGLGLSIVERIVFDHKGTIWFESDPGSGTTFFIDLPGENP